MKTSLTVAALLFVLTGTMAAGEVDCDPAAGKVIGDPVAGKKKSSKCVGCHGADGLREPAIAGMQPAYFIKQMRAYKSGARKHPLMSGLSKSLSDQDIADYAAYYGTMKGK